MSDMNSLVGRYVDRYHVVEQLGRGGMAVVYKAFDTRLNRNVALKVILPSHQLSPEALKRFQREAQAIAQLSHTHIVKIYDYGEQDGMPYLVMEYLPGGMLKRKMGQSLPYREAARLIHPIAQALAYAHQHKIIHRDVKPANILMTESGQPMLTDFGIAKMLETSDSTALTGTGVGIGTPEYMAPEQSIGQGVDYRADIYALGVVFYELVTGRRPYSADTPMAVMIKHLKEPLPRPRNFVPDLPEEVEQCIFRALAKDPNQRYQSMDEFAAALEKIGALQIPMPATRAIPSQPQSGASPSPYSTRVQVDTPQPFTPPPAQPGAAQEPPPRLLARKRQPVVEKKQDPPAWEQANQPVPSRPRLLASRNPPLEEKKSGCAWPLWIVVIVFIGLVGLIACGIIAMMLPALNEMFASTSGGGNRTTVVRLSLTDLPTGFRDMNDTDLEGLGLSGFVEEMGILPNANVENISVLMRGDPLSDKGEMVLNIVFYPLDAAEQAQFDRQVGDSATLSRNLSASLGSNYRVNIIPAGNSLGNKSIALAFSGYNGDKIPVAGELLLARRLSGAIMLFNAAIGQNSSVHVVDLGMILDRRFREVLK